MRQKACCILLSLGALRLLAGCDPAHSHMTSTCASETRADAYSAGLEKTSTSGNLVVRLLESQPGPPQKGDNTWTLQLRNGAGSPLTGATLNVTPYMPDHGHGTPIQAVSRELQPPTAAGQYSTSPINLFMPGLWQVTITATPTTAPQTPESVMFPFCIEG